MAKTCPEKRT